MNGQISIPRARRSDPCTAHQAAASVTNQTSTQRLILLTLDYWGPMSDRALLLRLKATPEIGIKLSESGLRTRRKELVDMGKLADSGKRETLPSGRKAIVWRLV